MKLRLETSNILFCIQDAIIIASANIPHRTCADVTGQSSVEKPSYTMYLKLKVLSQESRLPLHLPHKSCLWGRLGSTWRCVIAQEQRALLQVWKEKLVLKIVT